MSNLWCFHCRTQFMAFGLGYPIFCPTCYGAALHLLYADGRIKTTPAVLVGGKLDGTEFSVTWPPANECRDFPPPTPIAFGEAKITLDGVNVVGILKPPERTVYLRRGVDENHRVRYVLLGRLIASAAEK